MPGIVTCSFIDSPAGTSTPVMDAGVNTIYIWQGTTDHYFSQFPGFYQSLNEDERIVAARYHFEKDRQRYVVQHGILRKLLCRYLNVTNADLVFSYNPSKKPYLGGALTNKCFFNISHTKGELLIALGNISLGADIEKVNTGFDYADVAGQWFSANEVDFINNSINPTEAFYLLWTRKEALLKACGTGIDDNLPLMPALDGRHQLPSGYDNTHWLTTSFHTEE
jgi:4'-phosphopantetheinyl transferase